MLESASRYEINCTSLLRCAVLAAKLIDFSQFQATIWKRECTTNWLTLYSRVPD